jgi:hypothetical protein
MHAETMLIVGWLKNTNSPTLQLRGIFVFYQMVRVRGWVIELRSWYITDTMHEEQY